MIIYAPNVHTGGGKVLLDTLLLERPFGKISAVFSDERYEVPVLSQNTISLFKVKPTIWQRFKAEFELKKLWEKHKSPILFFGNLPPLFLKTEQSILYLQNCMLLPGVPRETNNWKVSLRLLIERVMLRMFLKNISEVWVQSDWMVEKVKEMDKDLNVKKKPFLPTLPLPQQKEKIFDFISVASLDKHKKVEDFLTALKILDKHLSKKINIALVLNGDAKLISETKKYLKNIFLKVMTQVDRKRLFDLMESSRISVVTSHYESFCLPVFESLHFGLKVLGPKMPYLENISSNIEFYNPNSPQHLAELMQQNLEDSQS